MASTFPMELSDSEDEDSVYGSPCSLLEAGVNILPVKQFRPAIVETKVNMESPFLHVCQIGVGKRSIQEGVAVDHNCRFPKKIRRQYQPIAYLGGAPFGPYSEGDLFLCRDKLQKSDENNHVILKYFLEGKVQCDANGKSEGPVEILKSGLVCSHFVSIYCHTWIEERYLQVLEYVPFSFDQVVKPGVPLGDDAFEYLAFHMFLTFKQLHNSGVVYRDFKPGNMGFNSKGEVVFFDTGGLWRSEVSQRSILDRHDHFSELEEQAVSEFEIVGDDTVDDYTVVEPTLWMGSQNYMPADKADHYYQDRWALAVVLLEVRLGSNVVAMLKNPVLQDTDAYGMLEKIRDGKCVDNYDSCLKQLYEAYSISPLDGEHEMITELFNCKGKYQKETGEMYHRLTFMRNIRKKYVEQSDGNNEA